MNYSSKFKYFLFFTVLVVGFLSFSSDAAAQAGGGVRGVYQRDSVILGTYVENIDFPTFHNTLFSRTGQFDDITVTWRGQIRIDVEGSYNFRVDVRSREYSTLYISETEFWTGRGDNGVSVHLTPGWHSFWMQAIVEDLPPPFEESQLQLYWQPPGQGESIVPATHLDPRHWADDIIVIPDINKPRQPISYKTAGVGVRVPGAADASQIISNPTIQVSDLPGPILRDEVFMVYAYSTDTSFTVRNNITGVSRNVTGTRASDLTGNPVNVIYTKLPQDVIPSSGDLSLTFNNISYTRADGIAIIVPYIDSDPERPLGRISLRIDGRHFYREPGPVFVYPVGDDLLINRDLRPVFIFGDGETERLAPGRYRPNYLLMLSGTGAPPPETGRLEDYPGYRRLLPRNGPINAGDPSTWYPNYGREGSEFDIISSNYLSNEWSGANNTGGGYLAPLTIPDNHSWVAFQYVSDYVDIDGVPDASPNSPESGFVIGGGIFAIRSLLPEPSVTPPIIERPDPPSNLSAQAPNCSEVSVRWTDNSDNELGFKLERRVGAGAWSQIALLGANVERYSDRSVGQNITYTYRVRAYNGSADSDYSNEATVTVPYCPFFDLIKSNDIKAVFVKGSADPADSDRTTIRVQGFFGFDDTVRLTVEDVSPAIPGISTYFHDPPSDGRLTPDEYNNGIGSEFWVTVPSNTTETNYVITIRGDGGGLVDKVSINLSVESKDPKFKEF
jgi:hypothetical protein